MEGNPPFQTVGRAEQSGRARPWVWGRTAGAVKKGALAVRSQEGGRERGKGCVRNERYDKIGLDPSGSRDGRKQGEDRTEAPCAVNYDEAPR